jgi:hypothetical protein
MKKLLFVTLVVSGLLATSVAFADPIGSTATWLFNLPSTAVASQNPPYPLVATLTLTQNADGVQFLLAPNWFDPTAGFSPQSFIERLDYVYKDSGAGLTDGKIDKNQNSPPVTVGDFRWDAGAKVKEFSYETGQNMDSGYKAEDQRIIVDFTPSNQDPLQFDNFYASSEWTVLGTSLSQFTGTFATHNSHPSPTQGIISVTAYSLDDPKPTPSNWVTGPGVSVPEPMSLILLGSGLLGLAGYGRKKFFKK